MQRKAFLVAGAGMFLSGCGRHSTSPARFQDIDRNGEPLRSAFNLDVDRVRILMLVSPT